MQTLEHSIVIKAPVQTVWHTMLNDETYRKWTKEFSEGSYYEGDWSEGSSIKFLGPDPETGKEGGMISRIKENREYEFISIQHLGFMQDDKEILMPDWQDAYENYTFTEHEDGTLLTVHMNTEEDWTEDMNAMWPKALKKLKDMCEQ